MKFVRFLIAPVRYTARGAILKYQGSVCGMDKVCVCEKKSGR